MTDPVKNVGASTERTAEYWTAIGTHERPELWRNHPVCQDWMKIRRGGLSVIDSIARCVNKTGTRAASLGCGAGVSELALLKSGIVNTYDVFDITPSLLENAAKSAAESGLTHRFRPQMVDMNQVQLPVDSYDLVTFFSSLHHVADLEGVLNTCWRGLRSGGVLFAQEYVGPNRFAFPSEHVAIAKQFYRNLDPTFRCVWPELPVPNPRDVEQADPSESIHSAEIIPAIRRICPGASVVSFDIALTVILWYGLNYGPLYQQPQGHDLVQWILNVDQAFIQSARISTYQVEIIAIKP